MKHYSVLRNEVLDNLNIKGNGTYIDATVGYAGHSAGILVRLTKRGFLFAFDQDEEAIQYSQEALSQIGPNFKIIHSNFSNMKTKMQEQNISKVDGIIFDLGLSSPQIDDKNRGFSFMRDAKLDMRMDKNKDFSAYEVVNNYSLEKLINIFYLYGEEKLSKAIAKKIIESRPIESTIGLVEVIKKAVGAKYFNEFHPERKIFQSIRIEVNSELKVLETVLPDAIDLLRSGGRLCVITFHSLEDRIVKNIFKEYSEVDEMVKGLPNIPEDFRAKIKIINKKPILPSAEEIDENSRSKSAKLRVIERV